jgi:2-hydroxymuconate-semialdehyde hydrolase
MNTQTYSELPLDHAATARTTRVLGVDTHFHEAGDGPPLLLLHGSGPGASAWSNWQPLLPILSSSFRVIAPDQIGFNLSQAEGQSRYGRDLWTDHALALADQLGLEHLSVIGNSMGGGIALSMAAKRPQAVDRIVAMGTVGIRFDISPGLEQVWGYRPSFEAMRSLMELFAYDGTLVTDDLVQMRYEASAEPTIRDAFSAMFPEPRQAGVDDLALTDEELRSISAPVLLAHGMHDRVVPMASTALPLLEVLPNAQLHAFGKSGQWVMIEETQAFASVVLAFLNEDHQRRDRCS